MITKTTKIKLNDTFSGFGKDNAELIAANIPNEAGRDKDKPLSDYSEIASFVTEPETCVVALCRPEYAEDPMTNVTISVMNRLGTEIEKRRAEDPNRDILSDAPETLIGSKFPSLQVLESKIDDHIKTRFMQAAKSMALFESQNDKIHLSVAASHLAHSVLEITTLLSGIIDPEREIDIFAEVRRRQNTGLKVFGKPDDPAGKVYTVDVLKGSAPDLVMPSDLSTYYSFKGGVYIVDLTNNQPITSNNPDNDRYSVSVLAHTLPSPANN